MTVHLLTLPHADTVREHSWDAYVQKIRRTADMLTDTGHHVLLYGGERSDSRAGLVTVVTDSDRQAWFGDRDFRSEVYNDFDPASPCWKTYNERAAEQIALWSEPGDVLGVTMGTAHKPVADALPHLRAVETGIGYSGVFAPFRVYESWAWRNYLTGRYLEDDVRFFDDVIPNAYHPDEFGAGSGDGGYALFIGRLTRRKGPHIAAEAAKRAGVPLYVAGQGVASTEPGRITCTDGTVLEGDVNYLGVLGPAERAEVMGKASCVLVPTLYLEPFGGVSVEAQLTGTPVVCSAWGGLVENVKQDETGFACSMLRDFVYGIEQAPNLDRHHIRSHALGVWSTDVVKYRYADYLDRLSTLDGDGWYAGAEVRDAVGASAVD